MYNVCMHTFRQRLTSYFVIRTYLQRDSLVAIDTMGGNSILATLYIIYVRTYHICM